jgi:hypothetical protein
MHSLMSVFVVKKTLVTKKVTSRMEMVMSKTTKKQFQIIQL